MFLYIERILKNIIILLIEIGKKHVFSINAIQINIAEKKGEKEITFRVLEWASAKNSLFTEFRPKQLTSKAKSLLYTKLKKIFYHMNFIPEKLDGRKLKLFDDANELHRLYHLNLVDEALLIPLIKASSK